MDHIINVVSAGVVPEYSVVCYYVKGKCPYVGYLIRGSGTNMVLINPLGAPFIIIDAEDLVELLATPAATACFYIGRRCKAS